MKNIFFDANYVDLFNTKWVFIRFYPEKFNGTNVLK